jgi:hypothetical protein
MEVPLLLKVALSQSVIAAAFTYLKEQFPTVSFKVYFPLIDPNPYYLLVASMGSFFKGSHVLWLPSEIVTNAASPTMLDLLSPDKNRKQLGPLYRVYVMKCSSQLVALAIFTPGALEL